MKRVLKCVALLAFGRAFLVHGQGAFQNLGFESAVLPNPPPTVPTMLLVSNVLPQWTAYIGTNQTQVGWYNAVSLGGALVGVIDRNSPFYSSLVISGNFRATIDSGEDTVNNTSEAVSAALAQTSLVPVTTRSLRFSASGNIVGYLSVTFNGQDVPFFPLATGSNFVTYGGDMTAFAGATGELRFTERPITPPTFPIAFLDNILFSNQVVPEPSTVSIVMVIASFFLVRDGLRRR